MLWWGGIAAVSQMSGEGSWAHCELPRAARCVPPELRWEIQEAEDTLEMQRRRGSPIKEQSSDLVAAPGTRFRAAAGHRRAMRARSSCDGRLRDQCHGEEIVALQVEERHLVRWGAEAESCR